MAESENRDQLAEDGNGVTDNRTNSDSTTNHEERDSEEEKLEPTREQTAQDRTRASQFRFTKQSRQNAGESKSNQDVASSVISTLRSDIKSTASLGNLMMTTTSRDAEDDIDDGADNRKRIVETLKQDPRRRRDSDAVDALNTVQGHDKNENAFSGSESLANLLSGGNSNRQMSIRQPPDKDDRIVEITELPVEPKKDEMKIMLVGDSGVGKTCFILQWAEGSYNSMHIPTVGLDCHERPIRLSGNNMRVELWDTAGSETFDSVTSQFYQNMEGIVILFDLTNLKSFQNVKNWMDKIKAQTKSVPLPIVLVGNKSDLDEHRMVRKTKLQVFAKEHDVRVYETCCKYQINIEEPVQDVCGQALTRRKELRALRNKLKRGGKTRAPTISLGKAEKSKNRPNSRSQSFVSGRSRGRGYDDDVSYLSQTRRSRSMGRGKKSRFGGSRTVGGTRRKCTIL